MKTCSDEKQRFFTTAATAATLAPGRDRLDLLPSSLSSQSSSGSFLGSSSSGGGGMWQQTAHSPHTSTVAVVAKANARLCCCRDEEQAKLHPAATYCAEITKRYLEEDQDDDDDEDDEAQLSTPIIYDMLRDLNILNREYENILSDEPDHMHSLSFSSTRRHHHHHQQQHVNDVNAHQMLQCDVPFYSVLDEHQGGEVRCCNGGGDDVVDDDGPFAQFDTSDDLLGAYDASSHIASPPTDALGAAPEVFGGCRKRKDEPDGGGGCSSTPSLLDAAAAATTLHPLSISHVLSQSIQNIADSSSCIIDYNNNNSSSRSMLGGRVEVQNRRYSPATTARCMACMLGDESDLRFDTARSCCQGLERGNHSDVARCAVIGQTRRAHTLGAIGSESQLFGASSPSNIQVSDCENQRLDLTKSRQKLPLSHHKYHLPSSSFHNPLPSFRASVPNYYESPHRTYETTSVNNSSANCSALKSSDQSKSKSSRHHNHHHHHHHPHQNNNQPQHHQTNHRNSSKKYAAINCDPAAKHNQIYHQRSEQNCGASSSRKNSQMSSANAGSNSSSGSNGAGGGGSQKLYSFCTFCKNNGESEAIYGTHYLKDIGGVVTCPILRAYTCPICGQSGDRAHTVKYCPFMSQLAAAASKTTLKPAGASSESNNQIFSSIAADGSPASHNNHNAGSAANANNAFIGDSATALLTGGGGGGGVALSMPFRSEMRVLRTARTSAGKRRFL